MDISKLTPEQNESLVKLEKLEKEYNKQKEKLATKYLKPLNDLKSQIVENGCFHPRTTIRKHDNDNGYGKWWVTMVKTCDLCCRTIEVAYPYEPLNIFIPNKQ
jgi:hypothetical protein